MGFPTQTVTFELGWVYRLAYREGQVFFATVSNEPWFFHDPQLENNFVSNLTGCKDS